MIEQELCSLVEGTKSPMIPWKIPNDHKMAPQCFAKVSQPAFIQVVFVVPPSITCNKKKL